MLIKKNLLLFLQIMIFSFSISYCFQVFPSLREYPFVCLTERTELQKNLADFKTVYGNLAHLIDDPFMKAVQKDISVKRVLKIAEREATRIKNKAARDKYNDFIQLLNASPVVQEYQHNIVKLSQNLEQSKIRLAEQFEFDSLCKLKQLAMLKKQGCNNPYDY